MGLIGGIARTAVAAGTWTAVSNAVSRRQAGRWAAQGPAPAADPARAAAQQAHAQRLAMPPPPGRYRRPMFQQHQPAPYAPYVQPAPVPAPPSGPPLLESGSPPAAPPAPNVDSVSARLEQLRQLGELKVQGVLTDAEFAAQKRKLLGG